RTPQCDLVVHHLPDVVAHQTHRGEQRTKFVGAAVRDHDVEFAVGDPLGDVRCSRNRPDDASCEQQGDDAGQDQRQDGAGDVELRIACDGGARDLTVNEAVAGGVVDKKVNLLVDLFGDVVERFPV